MRYFRVLTLAASMVVLIAAFNNCSVPLGAGDGFAASRTKSSTGPHLDYNGGGYSGKLSFLFYSDTDAPMCNGELYQADSKIDFENGVYTKTEGVCSGNPQSAAVVPLRNGYNPYYLIHNENVYFLNQGETALPAGKRVINYALCSSSSAAQPLDVVIRVEKTWNSVTNLWVKEIKGQKIAPNQPLLEELGKLRDPDANGTVEYGFPKVGEGTFVPTTFAVRLFNFGSAFKTSGEIYINSDFTTAIPADCYSIRN